MPAIAGVGFSSHFCDGEHRSTNVFSFSKQACCCADSAKDDCCSDQIKIVKLEKDQIGESSRISVKQLSQISELSTTFCFSVFAPFAKPISGTELYYSPPLLHKNFSVIHCTFLI
jgi:hypothetical protein